MTILLTVLAFTAPTPDQYTPRNRGCNTRACDIRVDKKMRHRRDRRRRSVVRPYRAWLASTRYCESGGRYNINTGNGFYGAYQFTISSWRAVGGRGMPHRASRLEQDYRAVRLLRVQGTGAWPVCG